MTIPTPLRDPHLLSLISSSNTFSSVRTKILQPIKLTLFQHFNMSNPWAKRDAWRYQAQFTRFNRFKNAFPGFGIGLGAFVIYVGYEQLTKKDTHGHH